MTALFQDTARTDLEFFPADEARLIRELSELPVPVTELYHEPWSRRRKYLMSDDLRDFLNAALRLFRKMLRGGLAVSQEANKLAPAYLRAELFFGVFAVHRFAQIVHSENVPYMVEQSLDGMSQSSGILAILDNLNSLATVVARNPGIFANVRERGAFSALLNAPFDLDMLRRPWPDSAKYIKSEQFTETLSYGVSCSQLMRNVGFPPVTQHSARTANRISSFRRPFRESGAAD